MKKKILFGIWLAFYVLCTGLSHIAAPTGPQATAMTLLSLFFFIPGGILLVDAHRSNDQTGLLQLRRISIASLGLTLIMLVVNILSAVNSEEAGLVLYEILIFVSVPMVCSQHWVLSMFLWALLLFSTFWKKKAS